MGQLRLGGLERQAFLLATNLDRRRFDVTVVCLSEGGAWSEELGRAGVQVLHLRRHGRWDVRRLWGLARIFRRLRPHIVYSFNYETNAYARIAGLLARVPILLTGERGFRLEGHQVILERMFNGITECVVTNADALRKDLVERVGLPPGKVVTIRNAVVVPSAAAPAEQAAARAALQVPAEDCVIAGTIARLSAVKNLDLLLEAAALTRDRMPSLAFRIVGGGPEEGRLQQEIRKRGLEGVVTLLGERPGASALLSAMDVFVLTSHSEGMPNTVMEAMAAGLPCVCTDVGGCRELVVDGATGYLVPPGDAGVLAERLVELASDPGRRRTMGESGRRRISNEFSVERLVSSTQSLLLGLLAAKDSVARGHRLTVPTLGSER